MPSIRKRLWDLIWLLLLLAPLMLAVHYWVAERSVLMRALFPLQALLSPVHCNDEAPAWLEGLAVESIVEMRALSNQLVWIDAEGRAAHCETGWKNGPFSTPLDETVRFRYGSLTKVVTSAAIFALEQEGKITRQASLVGVLFPGGDPREMASGVPSIRVADLLQHRSGLAGRMDTVFSPNPWCPYALDTLLSADLGSGPGSRGGYANVNYCLLGEVLAAVEGKPVRQALNERFSLDQRGIAFVNKATADDEVQRDYRENDFYESLTARPEIDYFAISATAGLSGSALAYARLVQDVLQQNLSGFLSSEEDSAGCNVTLLRNCYGNAFYLYKTEQGQFVNVKGGYLPGSAGMVVVAPEKGIFVWLGNSDTANAKEGKGQQWMIERLVSSAIGA